MSITISLYVCSEVQADGLDADHWQNTDAYRAFVVLLDESDHDQAVRNAVRLVGVDLCQAVRMASTNPARVLGLGRRKGRIARGYDADLVLLDDALRVTDTWVAGERVYGAQ